MCPGLTRVSANWSWNAISCDGPPVDEHRAEAGDDRAEAKLAEARATEKARLAAIRGRQAVMEEREARGEEWRRAEAERLEQQQSEEMAAQMMRRQAKWGLRPARAGGARRLAERSAERAD